MIINIVRLTLTGMILITAYKIHHYVIEAIDLIRYNVTASIWIRTNSAVVPTGVFHNELGSKNSIWALLGATWKSRYLLVSRHRCSPSRMLTTTTSAKLSSPVIQLGVRRLPRYHHLRCSRYQDNQSLSFALFGDFETRLWSGNKMKITNLCQSGIHNYNWTRTHEIELIGV